MIEVGSHHFHIYPNFSSEADGADQAIRGMRDAKADISRLVGIALHGGLAMHAVVKTDARRFQSEIVR